MTEYLLTGGHGLLGSEIRKQVECHAPTSTELNVLDVESIRKHITPDVNYLIHCAGITSVELCENQKLRAYKVNVNGTHNVLKALENTHVKLIHISTPCVFDGKRGGYSEKDLPFPDNYYGMTKAIAEELVLKSDIPHLVIRANFVGRKPWPYPKAFTDRIGNYLFADKVASEIIRRRNRFGLEHVIGKRDLTMYELAKQVSPEVEPMTMKEYNGNARLTMNMTMRSLFD
jgi:dTDP-4-dehydrorhamnose reductase